MVGKCEEGREQCNNYSNGQKHNFDQVKAVTSLAQTIIYGVQNESVTLRKCSTQHLSSLLLCAKRVRICDPHVCSDQAPAPAGARLTRGQPAAAAAL